MALLISVKSDIRRHLRYPLAGLFRNSPGGGQLADGSAGYRFFQAFGFLEWRLNNLMPDEEARTTGYAYGGISFSGPGAAVGDTATVTVTGGPLSAPVTVTVTATAQTTSNLNFCALVAQALAQNPILNGNGFLVIAPYGSGAFSQAAVPVPEVAITNSMAFTLGVSFTGQIAPQISADGSVLFPQLTLPSPSNGVVNGYIPILNQLESGWLSSQQNLDTNQAAVWRRNTSEVPNRKALYDDWRLSFAEFLAIPLNQPGYKGVKSRSMLARI